MRILRIVLKTLAWIIGIILLLLLLIVIAVQIPAVQNKLLASATPMIEDMLGGANVEIGHINIDFFDGANVDDVLIEDLRGDTLLYAHNLGIDLGVFSLLNSEIFVDEIRLDGAVVNAYQLREDSAFNYQFILDAFAPADTAVVDTSAAAFTIGLRTIDVTNTRIRLLDEKFPSDLNVRANRLLVNIDAIDLETLAVDVENVLLEGIRASYIIVEQQAGEVVADAAEAAATDTLATGTTVLAFPYAGMPVTVGEVKLSDINVRYADANTTRIEQGFDAGNVDITGLEALAQNFAWDSTRLALDWEGLSFRERSGLVVDDLHFALNMTPAQLELNEFRFGTDVSKVLAEAELRYTDFGSLAALDPSTSVNLVLDESYIAWSDIKLLAPTLEEAGVNLDARGNISACGTVSGTLAALELQNLSAQVGQQTAVAVSGTLSNPLDPAALAYNLNVNRLTSSYADLNRLTKGLELPPQLADFGRFRFSGKLDGTTTTFRGRNLDLRTDGRTGFRGDVSARNLDDPDNLFIDANVRELHTNTQEIAGFIPDSLGVDVMAFGDVDFQGTFKGTVTDFLLDGSLNTDIGSATADIDADFNSDYTDGTYAGTVALDSFNVGALLQDSTIGTLTMNVALDGSGLSPEAIATSMEGNVESFTYNNYTYRDLSIDGNFDRQIFKGQFAMNDPNVTFAFDGLVNLRDSLPDLVFDLRMDTLALQPLGFYPTALGLSTAITANLRGNSADNLVGRMLVDSFYLNDSVRFAYLDSLLLRAGDTTQGRFLAVTSPLIDAGIIGNYITADLPILLQNYINDFFPIDEYLSPVDAPSDLAIEPEPQRVLSDQSFEYYIGISKPLDFAHLFDPGLERLDTVSLVGDFDTKSKSLNGKLYIPNFNYAGTVVDTILVGIGGDANEMIVGLRTRGVAVAGQTIDAALVNLRLADDSLSFGVETYLTRDSLLLATALEVHTNDAGRYVGSFTEDLRVAGQIWNINPQNKIEYWAAYLDIDALDFTKDGQRISIASDDQSQDGDIAPLTVTIKDYQLEEVARLVQLDGFSLTGLIDGKLGIRQPDGNLYYTADLSINDIVLNDEPVGTLVANMSSVSNQDLVGIDVRLDGPINQAAIAGTYGIADGALDVSANVRAFELRVIDPLATGVLSNSSGLMKADLDITGNVDQPAVNGFVRLDGAQTTFDLLGTQLAVADSRINISETLLDFGTFVVADSVGRTMTLTGSIAHDYFADFAFDLNVKTKGFKVLNTAPSLTELYYGSAVVAANIDIDGDLELPKVSGTVKTLQGTDLVVVPLITTAGVTEESWVIYGNPVTIDADTSQSLSDVYNANALGIDLGMTINVDTASTLTVIVNPATGDKLVAHGVADMNVQMAPNGDINVTGNYEINNGSYQFTFEGGGLSLIQRDFDIRKGSSLQFVGDPLDTRFDIAATYTTQTTTFELLQAGPGGVDPNDKSASVQASKRRQPVNVVMNMAGSLEDPALTLDIEVPQAGGGFGNNKVEETLVYLRQQQDQLYKQVFGILVLNKFIPSDGGGGGGIDPAAAGKNIAINSISGLVTGQLNSLADNLVGDAFDIDIGLESYENQYLGRQNNASVDISRTLFSDRLTITFGTDVNVGQTQSTSSGARPSAIQTNFVITYQLTSNGQYLLRAFRRPDYDILSSAGANNETGVGVTFQRSFD